MVESCGRLLIVDDEVALADLLKKYMERLGYQADACSHPQQAIEFMTQAAGAYGLLVTDLTLPEMSGEALLATLRLQNPQLRAIIASGYPYEPQARGVEFLQKPFLPRMLADAVERVLQLPAIP
jgi:DNA-binding NtrC family response regulator